MNAEQTEEQIMMGPQGRGAWNPKGVGGTLKLSKDKKTTIPGPYYTLASDPENLIGSAVWNALRDMNPIIPINDMATFYGVGAIQRLTNRCLGSNIAVNGLYTKETHEAVIEVQKKCGLVADGLVGKTTMKWLCFMPIIATANELEVPWEPVYGILQNEGGWDPGAVGYMDTNDLGLAQINSIAWPEISLHDAFDPLSAIMFVADYIENSLEVFDNDIRLAVASYNLGIGGTRQWIAAGKPDVWLPSWSSTERKVNAYIDRILNAYKN